MAPMGGASAAPTVDVFCLDLALFLRSVCYEAYFDPSLKGVVVTYAGSTQETGKISQSLDRSTVGDSDDDIDSHSADFGPSGEGENEMDARSTESERVQVQGEITLNASVCSTRTTVLDRHEVVLIICLSVCLNE